jgi:YD repeat-containing protein
VQRSRPAHLVNASYDSQGRLYELTYPTSTSGYRFKARYAYDSAGALHRLLNGLAPAQILWEREASDALGRAQRVRLGNGLWEERYHDRASGHLAWAVVGTSAGGAQRMDLAYSWDKVGNLTSRSDLAQSKTETFSYDALHRLKTAHLNGTGYGYDANGRMTSRGGAAIIWYSYDLPQRINYGSGASATMALSASFIPSQIISRPLLLWYN